jgi:hypothetical protein
MRRAISFMWGLSWRIITSFTPVEKFELTDWIIWVFTMPKPINIHTDLGSSKK